MKIATFETTQGLLKAQLFDEEAPKTIETFCSLVESGFYDGLEFFKYIPQMLIQTGCPFNNGLGNAGFHIKSEVGNKKRYHESGIFSMVHGGKDTNSSQFIICLGERMTQHLNGNHTCFAMLTERRRDTLLKLRKGDRIEKVTIEEVERLPLSENLSLFRQ